MFYAFDVANFCHVQIYDAKIIKNYYVLRDVLCMDTDYEIIEIFI